MDISKKIKAIREERKISQSEIARRLGIEPTNYPRMEKRGDKLTVEQLGRIAGALGVTVGELLTDEPQTVQESERVKELEKRVSELEDRVNDKEELIRMHKFSKQIIGETIEVHIWGFINDFAFSNNIGTKNEFKPLEVDLSDNQIEEIFTYLMEVIDKDGFLKSIFALNVITDTKLIGLFDKYFNNGSKYRLKRGRDF